MTQPGQVQKGHATAALVMGILELIISIIVVICSFVLSGKASLSKSMTPYWAGLPYLVPGILGIVVGCTKNRCSMIAFMILNIICFVLQGVGTITVALVIAVWASYAAAISDSGYTSNCKTVWGTCQCYVDGRWQKIAGVSDCDILKGIVGLLYTIVALLVIGAIVALAGSIVGCMSVCCANNQQGGAIIVQQPGGVVVQQQQGYVMQPGYQQQGYPPQQQGYPPQQQGYPPQQQGYPPQQGSQEAGNPPAYAEKM